MTVSAGTDAGERGAQMSEKTRTDFESWAAGTALNVDRFGDEYSSDWTQSFWLCWLSSRRQALEEAAAIVEALRDDHCKGTRESPDPLDHCRPEGDDGCDFVSAWNEAASAIRREAEGK